MVLPRCQPKQNVFFVFALLPTPSNLPMVSSKQKKNSTVWPVANQKCAPKGRRGTGYLLNTNFTVKIENWALDPPSTLTVL